VRVEVPELLSLLARCFLEFVYLLVYFQSEFLKIYSELVPQVCVASRLRSDCFDLLKQRVLVRERPVPEDCVAVASLDLLDRNEIFGNEILLEEAQIALEGGVSACGISAEEDAFSVWMDLAVSSALVAESLLLLLLLLRVVIGLRGHAISVCFVKSVCNIL